MRRVEVLIVAVMMAIGFVHLGTSLRMVQIDEAADFRYDGARQSVRRVQTDGERGRILDRHGRVLAENRMSVSIAVNATHYQKRTWNGTVAALAQAISNVAECVGKKPVLSERVVRRHVDKSLAMPLVVWRDVDEEALARFSEHERDFPGFFVLEGKNRVYPYHSIAAHLLGYVGRDRGDVQAGDEKFNFILPEMRGRSGIEAFYDGFLRGVPGEKKVRVDARGFAMEEWTVVAPRRGLDLQLALDIDLQMAVEAELRGHRGACVVIDPRNGDVLAMASAPGFDPNEFVPVLTHEVYDAYASDPAKPLLNRACGGAYAPGSTFKPVTMLAGLKQGYPVDEMYYCNGLFELGDMKLRCTRRWGHGGLNVKQALMMSCNPFYCNLGMEVGTNVLTSVARSFGLGCKTGLDLGVDMAGVVPDADWKMRMYHEPWYPGDLAQMAIGQGMLLVSPLQMAIAVGAIAMGYRITPHLKLDVESSKKNLPFTTESLDIVREGMRMVVTGVGENRGTGWKGGEGVPVSVSGKTGTAEIGIGKRRRKNAWFVAFAPSEQPSIAVALVVENGDSGGESAAPKVANVLKEAFRER